jgi:hypothetical protein
VRLGFANIDDSGVRHTSMVAKAADQVSAIAPSGSTAQPPIPTSRFESSNGSDGGSSVWTTPNDHAACPDARFDSKSG